MIAALRAACPTSRRPPARDRGPVAPGRSTRTPLPALVALLALLLALPLAAPDLSAQQVDLRWKYQAGEELLYRITVRQEATMAAQGSQTGSQIQTMRWTVDEVAANGDATVTVTTERMQINQVGPTGSIDYDSETMADSTSAQNAMFGAIVDQSYTLVIAPDGTVKEVRGLEGMIDEMVAGFSPDMASTARQQFSQMFNEESIKDMMQQSIQSFPTEPVGPSDTWETSYSMPVPMLGEITTTASFTLDDVVARDGRQIAIISSTGTVSFGDAEGQLAGMVEMDDATVDSTMEFDVERGHVLSGTTETSMTMNLSAGGQPMSMEMANSMVMELIEYVPADG